jgi:pyruvate,water dikinase
MSDSTAPVRWFSDLGIADIPAVGGKNASLGELTSQLAGAGVPVPNGFALTAGVYRDALAAANAEPRLHALLDRLDIADVTALARAADEARTIVYAATGTEAMKGLIAEAYAKLEAEYGPGAAVAVRSSATAEDLPTASFAGQHESYLNVSGPEDVFEACRRCFASLFTDRAIVYRVNNGFDHFKVALSVGVMKMVRSDKASSGVIFTLDTESGFRDVIFITGAYGLGENVVQGTVDPDEFYVHKPTFRTGHRAVLQRTLGGKQRTMGLAPGHVGASTANCDTPAALRDRFCISDSEILTLADYAIRIEDYYSATAGRSEPMDIEWAKDAVDGKLYIVQARPETVASRKQTGMLETYMLRNAPQPVVTGKSVGEKIATGTARVIRDVSDLAAFRRGEVLVATETRPDWEPVVKTAAAIVTDHGGRTCHAAIVARELGVPAVVGAGDATTRLKTGEIVTVSCAGGEVGAVYEGALPFDITCVDAGSLPIPNIAIMVNLGDPDLAFRTAMMPNAGVGLARMEFIIAEHIGVHPMALVHPERVAAADRARIAALAAADSSPTEFFVRTLAEGIGTIAAAFWPKPVIVRLSDFKTNEYAQLIGGTAFEPREANPMLGFRGAARYAHPAYAEGFALECAALRRVRETMGLTNVVVMVPFCRRVEEANKVAAELARHGLRRGEDGFQLYVMCEIPNNVILVDEFSKVFDGFSIGSNDLTQLTLGVDRDSDIVAFDFDERDPGMLEMLRLAVVGAKRNHRKVGICGEAPANYPEIARFLAGIGIDSISVNPSSLLRTIEVVGKLEQEAAPRERIEAPERKIDNLP